MGVSPYRPCPNFKSHPLRRLFLFHVLSLELYQEEWVLCHTSSHDKHLLAFVNQYFYCCRVHLKIVSDLCGHQSRVVLAANIYKNVVGLTYRFHQSVFQRSFSRDGFQVVHLEDSLVFKDKICCRLFSLTHYLLSNVFCGQVVLHQ